MVSDALHELFDAFESWYTDAEAASEPSLSSPGSVESTPRSNDSPIEPMTRAKFSEPSPAAAVPGSAFDMLKDTVASVPSCAARRLASWRFKRKRETRIDVSLSEWRVN